MFQGTVNDYCQDRGTLGRIRVRLLGKSQNFFWPIWQETFLRLQDAPKKIKNMKICLAINNGKRYNLLRNPRENSLQSVLPHILKTFPKNEKHRQSRSGM